MNILFVLFAAVLLVTIGLLLIFGLSGTPIESKDSSLSNDTQVSNDAQVSLVPFPDQDYKIYEFFRSMKTVTSARAFKYDATKGIITLGNEPDMRKWNIDYPLNFTHARISGEKIYKFNHPNTSDSSGTFVAPSSSVTSDFTFTQIEFGMFF